jgi:hypothetical protein
MYLVVFVLNQIKCTLLFKNKTVALCKVASKAPKRKKGSSKRRFQTQTAVYMPADKEIGFQCCAILSPQLRAFCSN